MKVIAINGSPHPQGNTFHALKTIGEELKKENIEFEILQVGSQNIHGCMGCNMCFRNKNEKCVITTDSFNELLQKIKDVDGIILGSPVHFSGIAGTMKCFLDRAFYVSGAASVSFVCSLIFSSHAMFFPSTRMIWFPSASWMASPAFNPWMMFQ